MAGMPALSSRDRNILIASVVAVALAGAYGYFLWLPAKADLDLVETKVAQLDSSNAKAKKLLQRGKL